MNDFSHFENTVTKAVWKQQCSSTNNLICGEMNCYSNCHIDYKSNILLDLKGFLGRPCHECNHSLRHHHRWTVMWRQLIDMKVSVDENMKEKWEAAKDGKEKTEALIAAREKVLNELDQVIEHATDDLEQQVERYARLALSGSFSAQVTSAVRLLEQNYAVMEKKHISPDQLQRIKESLDLMKRKLELLNTAKENARRGRVEIGSQVKKVFGL